MYHPFHIPFTNEPRLTYKTIVTEYSQWLKLKTQRFISQQYSKYDLCDTCAVFYQLSSQVNWKVIMVYIHLNPCVMKIST